MKRKADQVQLEDRQAGKIAKGQNRLKPEDKEVNSFSFFLFMYIIFQLFLHLENWERVCGMSLSLFYRK